MQYRGEAAERIRGAATCNPHATHMHPTCRSSCGRTKCDMHADCNVQDRLQHP